MRVAVLDKSKCTRGEKCNYACIKVCPRVRAGDETITIDEEGYPVIAEELCVGCGICVHKCPFGAISIVNLPEELKTQEVHRYGKNAFRLYRIPIPTKDQVVGILGRNGIGKTTAINILSGLIKPNLGNYEKTPEDKEIIKFFKGGEAQQYFTDLYAGKVKVSVKPQYVDLIPKQFKGKVSELLKRNSENITDVAKLLEIENILDRDISSLSGGELQRVAIAAAILRKADVTFFDEPSSYLDIKQRLKVAKVIRKLKDKSKSIIVIEHDLIVLDYICDLLHVMYGKEKVYGIVSHPYSTRNGINAYIEGYLKDENVRFRDSRIEFRDKPPTQTQDRKVLLEFPDMETKLGSFTLKINKGHINTNEVIGILGANATGKTTFAKILAGVIPGFKTPVKISYKPQYIEPSRALVSEVVSMKIKNILTHLGIDQLMNRSLDTLSGGELQRVAIAACLSRDADIYLLDEPSAYLDVEQRLLVSKILRDFIVENNKSAFVIDHDLLFLDYVSDRFMIFKGQPSVFGETFGPMEMEEGMNMFLKDLGITFRRDPVTKRPRANKEGSIKDKEQKALGKYYYT